MDDITNQQVSTAQPPVEVAEENSANTETQAQDNNVEGAVENGNTNNTEQNTEQQNADGAEVRDDVPKEPTQEELKNRLKEYELREEEDRALRDKLGLPDNIDNRTYDYMNIDQQIVNSGKQEYLKLCNIYGVDADPAKLDASIEELKKTDPAKGYEFIERFKDLNNAIGSRRQAVQQEVSNYEINRFAQDYNQLLSVSPALNNIVSQYVSQYGGYGGSMYEQLNNVINTVMPAYNEAFEAGKRYALEGKAKVDTTPVQGGAAVANTNTYAPGTVFTRDQIRHMSPDEFAKNEKAIKQAMIDGKIQ